MSTRLTRAARVAAAASLAGVAVWAAGRAGNHHGLRRWLSFIAPVGCACEDGGDCWWPDEDAWGDEWDDDWDDDDNEPPFECPECGA